jgi:agmatinase
MDSQFNPDGGGQRNDSFGGLPFTPETAAVVLLPVPWDVTVSYGDGTAAGPAAILKASPQLDFYDERIADAWKIGIAMESLPKGMPEENARLRRLAVGHIGWLEAGSPEASRPAMETALAEINAGCARMVGTVQAQAAHWLDRKKIVGVIGGDHSTPLGLIRELAKRHGSFGILHFDAHRDLREAYEGFTFSHASIMHNAIREPAVSRLVQVGVRDFCETEDRLARKSGGRIRAFTGRKLHRQLSMGASWSSICEAIIDPLPGDLYVSFDIDALDPWLCPHTGTPVPGGLDYEQVFYLLELLIERGHRIIGFDLTEVAPGPDNEWDASVGARIAYRLSCLAAASHGLLKMREL